MAVVKVESILKVLLGLTVTVILLMPAVASAEGALKVKLINQQAEIQSSRIDRK